MKAFVCFSAALLFLVVAFCNGNEEEATGNGEAGTGFSVETGAGGAGGADGADGEGGAEAGAEAGMNVEMDTAGGAGAESQN
ncbi:multifunctional esterase-like [Anabrus simplex]|uniref:multifunctional esterase-like n=1 Tax=Anabrus simplex TaxID=316456 RepID=UPI0035A376F5